MIFLKRILNDDNPSELSFEEIYNSCYKVCINKGEVDLLNKLDANLTTYLSGVQNKLLSMTDEEFYEKFLSYYFDYLNKVNVIQKTMMYLENNYLSRKGSSVTIISKTKFKNFFFKADFELQIREFLLININKDRNKLLINKILFYNVIKMIVFQL